MTAKRLFDVAVALLAIALLWPFVALLALAIWARDGRSPFYLSPRVGRGNRDFAMVKLRTMVVGADALGASSAARSDARITGFGRFLRRWKLDELPQFANVLVGHMSVVGPRPERSLPAGSTRYTPEEMGLLAVRPASTDLASIVFADEAEILEGAPTCRRPTTCLSVRGSAASACSTSPGGRSAADLQLTALTFVAIVARPLALRLLDGLLRRWDADTTTRELCLRKEPLRPSLVGTGAVVTGRVLPARQRSGRQPQPCGSRGTGAAERGAPRKQRGMPLDPADLLRTVALAAGSLPPVRGRALRRTLAVVGRTPGPPADRNAAMVPVPCSWSRATSSSARCGPIRPGDGRALPARRWPRRTGCSPAPTQRFWYAGRPRPTPHRQRLRARAGYRMVGEGRRTSPLGIAPLGRFVLDRRVDRHGPHSAVIATPRSPRAWGASAGRRVQHQPLARAIRRHSKPGARADVFSPAGHRQRGDGARPAGAGQHPQRPHFRGIGARRGGPQHVTPCRQCQQLRRDLPVLRRSARDRREPEWPPSVARAAPSAWASDSPQPNG